MYSILREDENDSTAYPLSLVDSTINAAYNSLMAGTIMEPSGWYMKKGKLPFLQKHAFYQNVLSTTLSVATTVWASSLSITVTTNLSSVSPSYLWVAGNIVSYTWKTSTTVTWVQNVLFAHLSGTRLYQAFTLPTDYMNTVQVSYNNSVPVMYMDENEIYQMLNGIKAWWGNNYSYISTQSTTQFPQNKAFYTIADGLYFLPFFIDNNTGMFHLVYNRQVTALSATTDAVIIPSDIFALDTIPYVAVAELMFNRGEEQRGQAILAYAYPKIKSMYSYYNKQGSEDNQLKSYTMDKGKLNL